MNLLTLLLVALGLGGISIVIGMALEKYTLVIGACGAILIVLVAILVIDANRLGNAEDQAGRVCFPNVVTHLARDGDRLIFDCANDGRLRTVRIRP